MSKIYKVWLHIEEIDEDEDHYEDLGMPESVAAEFNTFDDADKMLKCLVDFGNLICS